MNAPASPANVAEAKRLLSVEEFIAVCEAGVFPEGEHVELWDGEMIMAPSEGGRHFVVNVELMHALIRAMPSDLKMGPTGPLQIGDKTLLEPDLFWFQRRPGYHIPIPSDMKLVVEVSVTSLQRDRTEKALRYALAGIEDYWVVDAENLITWVYRKPSAEGFGEVREHAPNEQISPLAAPSISIRMVEIFPA